MILSASVRSSFLCVLRQFALSNSFNFDSRLCCFLRCALSNLFPFLPVMTHYHHLVSTGAVLLRTSLLAQAIPVALAQRGSEVLFFCICETTKRHASWWMEVCTSFGRLGADCSRFEAQVGQVAQSWPASSSSWKLQAHPPNRNQLGKSHFSKPPVALPTEFPQMPPKRCIVWKQPCPRWEKEIHLRSLWWRLFELPVPRPKFLL